MISIFLRNLFSFPDLKKIDFLFFGPFIFLCIFGLLAVASASIQFSVSLTGDPLNLFTKQLFHLLAGLLFFSLLLSIPLSFWERFDRLLLGFGLFLLMII